MLSIESFYKHPYVVRSEFEDLVIFQYTRACQYDRAWDEVTMAARGIIFNKVTGELVSRPFPKFFNASELGYDKLPNLPFTATVKMDGSLCISYPYKGSYRLATKCSFKSDQSVWATDWMQKNIRVDLFRSDVTYLFEAIYRQNKIVIDYGDYEGLTLLACIETATGVEIPYEELLSEAARIGAPAVKCATGFRNLDDLYRHCKTLPMSEEGFVITFSNGLKVKIKGEEYCRVHKLLAYMTPLSFWEAWDLDLKDIPKNYLEGLPEEFRETCDMLHGQIYNLHWDLFNKYKAQYTTIMSQEFKGSTAKEFAAFLLEHHNDCFSQMMAFYNKREKLAWKSIHNMVRPTKNVLPEGIAGSDRINRILHDNG